MSAETRQSRLDVGDAPAEHLSAERLDGHGHPLNKPNEWHCVPCGARVTISPDGQREYGHRGACDHRLQWGEGE